MHESGMALFGPDAVSDLNPVPRIKADIRRSLEFIG
jgi:hypothetical protein